jgi:hypothetical protein
MKKIYTTLVLIIGLNIVSPFGFSQNNQIKIEFIGNASLYMTDGNLHVYVDFPYKSGAHNYMEYDESQVDRIQEDAIVIFTHRHADHYSKKLVNNIKGRVYGNWNTETLNELNNSVEGFSVKAIKTPHKFTTKHYSYVITWHNKKIYISGDTGDLEEVSKIKDIDWAFINPWLFMNAQNEKVTIDAKMFGIYHLYPDQKVPEERPDNIVFLKEQNKILLLPY